MGFAWSSVRLGVSVLFSVVLVAVVLVVLGYVLISLRVPDVQTPLNQERIAIQDCLSACKFVNLCAGQNRISKLIVDGPELLDVCSCKLPANHKAFLQRHRRLGIPILVLNPGDACL